MRSTYMQRQQDVTRDFLVIDAEGQTLGRLASEVASLLRGKHKPTFTPHVDGGDAVIIINAEKIKLSGNKLLDKVYYRHTGYPGGLRATTAGEMLEKHPDRLITLAVTRMLPKNKLGSAMARRLFVYAGENHKHEAQNPKAYTLKG